MVSRIEDDMYMTYADAMSTILSMEYAMLSMQIAIDRLKNAILRCINCGTPLADNATYCERCGFENNDLLK